MNDLTEISFPNFVHETEDETGKHTYRGSLIRHLSVEKALYALQRILNEIIGDAFIGYDLLDTLLIISFGLNCNFPLQDIFRYIVWYLKGCPETPSK